MEWLLLTAATAAVTWIVEKTLDALLERWRRKRRIPLTMDQVRRLHRLRFGIAAFQGTVVLLLALVTAGSVMNAPSIAGACTVIALLLLLGYVTRVVRRRWRRLRECG